MIFESIGSKTIQHQPEKNIQKIQTIQPPKIVDKNLNEVITQLNKETKTESDKKKIYKDITETLNDFQQLKNNKIAFDYDEEANVFVVMVKDMKNNEIIKQFPTEEFIKRLLYYRELEEKNLNLFLDETA